jgi:hypothetical protein
LDGEEEEERVLCLVDGAAVATTAPAAPLLSLSLFSSLFLSFLLSPQPMKLWWLLIRAEKRPLDQVTGWRVYF